MQASDNNTRGYDDFWTELNDELRELELRSGLGAALEALQNQQRDIGFIQDGLNDLNRYRFLDPEDDSRFFCVQYNPSRAKRFSGAGLTTVPAGMEAVNNGCFLCPDNIRWQQRGIEFGYDIDVSGSEYVVWMNAFPMMPVHAVIASRAHVPQAWCFDNENGIGLTIDRLLSELVTIADRLPGFIGFYNGEGAGASITGHLHFQFFKRPENNGLFPLEMAAKKSKNVMPDYPVAVVFWQGQIQDIVDQASQRIAKWIDVTNGGAISASANFFAISDDGNGLVQLYFVPRDQMRSHSPEMAGEIGGMEILGELIFSEAGEKARLERGEVDYRTIERILSAVNVPCDDHVRHFLEPNTPKPGRR